MSVPQSNSTYTMERLIALPLRLGELAREGDVALSVHAPLGFLDERERCTVYDVRPTSCAALYVYTPPALCNTRSRDIEALGALVPGGGADAALGLDHHGLGAAEVQQLLEPVEQLLGDHSFWQHQSDGLALFLSPHFSRSYRLPLAFEELAVVALRYKANLLTFFEFVHR